MKHLPWLLAAALFVVSAIPAGAAPPAAAVPPAAAAPVDPADPNADPPAPAAQSDTDEDPADGPGEDPGTGPAAVVRDEIVVSAQAVEAPRERVGSSVTVIDRAEIEARRAPSLVELLRTVPGVEVSRTGPPGGNASVFVRGASSSHTLVLVDGVRVNSPAVGSFDFAGLSTHDVERIEVVRGPQSALYGSEALGGVIAIFTRRGTEDGQRLAAGAEAGTEDSGRLTASWRGGGGAWDWSLAASRRSFDGVSAASEAAGNTEADPFRATSASALLGRDLGDGGRAELSLRYLDSENGLDGFAFGVGPVDDPNYRQAREAIHANLRLEVPVTDRWTQHLRLGTAREDLAATDPDTAFHPFAVETTVDDAVLQADLVLRDGDGAGTGTGGGELEGGAGGLSDVLSLGAGYERREADSVGSFAESVDVASAFAENRLAWGERLFLATGVRHDDHSVFGGETTWRGTAAWLVAGGLRLHGSYGTGFRAPTFNELYFPGFGNPGLLPETSEGWDAGLEATSGDGRLRGDLTAFATDFDNLIDFDFATFRAENVAAARVRGAEAQLSWLVGAGLEARASYTWTDAEDRATGEPLARRPRHRATVTALYDPAGPWDGSLALAAVADRVDSDGTPMADYERLDGTVGYRVWDPVGVYLRVENLLDDDGAEVLGYTTPGRVVTVGVAVRLGG